MPSLGIYCCVSRSNAGILLLLLQLFGHTHATLCLVPFQRDKNCMSSCIVTRVCDDVMTQSPLSKKFLYFDLEQESCMPSAVLDGHWYGHRQWWWMIIINHSKTRPRSIHRDTPPSRKTHFRIDSSQTIIGYKHVFRFVCKQTHKYGYWRN